MSLSFFNQSGHGLLVYNERDRLIINMGIPIPGSDVFILKRVPGPLEEANTPHCVE